MEENQARKPQPYQSQNLARQPYFDPDELPLEAEADGNVVPMKPRLDNPALDSVAENPLLPRSTAKRKQSSKKTAAAKQKSVKSFRSPQSAKQAPFADELQHLENLAERINQILAERAQQQSQTPPVRYDGATYSQPYQPPAKAIDQSFAPQPASLEAAGTETLKRQAKRIRQRLSELEAMMDTPFDRADAAQFNAPAAYPDSAYSDSAYPNSAYSDQIESNDRVYPNPPAQTQPDYTQRGCAQPDYIQPSYTQPSYAPPQAYPPSSPVEPVRHRSDYEAQRRAQEELRQLMSGQLPTQLDTPRDRRAQPFEPALRQSMSLLRRLRVWQLLELPRKPIDRLGNAAMWVAIAVVFRVSSRYVLSAFPLLSPVFTLLMLAPAVLAVFLAVFVPKTGWIPFYRLFLVMLGLFIGGKL